MTRITEKEWLEDFQEFVQGDNASVPESVTKAVFAQVHRDLNPSPWLVFAKLLGIHAVVGTLSLAICNQFGISPFRSEFSLSEYFMKFGHSTCMFLCGVLFLGLSLALWRVFGRAEELRVLQKSVWLQVFGLSMLSLGVFAVMGAELTLTFGLLWFVGAMVAGVGIASIPTRISFRMSL